ncbi:Undecaprenyl phosphate N,N'-diacetylbacillosamine 1-phosphate transferase [Rosistilla carotiformis]|uniref:Undecaprenyl phosphate N,N'-diacetylbacillosamine 1-phosphate transferase n=1 Tax=Rosistilla carotiformis TaxID=2528017 RepID=A0A518JP03_9BACT|nr:sugar transferase [Rosistilla carotiformis]QDV67263.1 Undecaprenyl phosphate N,N'-diacetylbacillosamine 1-phosphate transferase [Rosistilla carotiformis]
MKRGMDFCLALLALLVLTPLILVVGFAVRLTSPGPVIYWSERVGRRNVLFSMPKFRTMYLNTPQLATHLLEGAEKHITPLGNLLRKTSLDELPQLWSVLVGHMSLVGPRPALFNQDDLVALRTQKGVQRLRPGITGWAQVNGRDELKLHEKVEYDVEYMQKISTEFDLKVLLLTMAKVLRRDGIQQAKISSHSNDSASEPQKRAA